MTQTNIFTNIRVPLIVLVIFIHVYAGLNNMIDIDLFQISPVLKYISLVLARVAVPFFFILSGFFYFYNVNKFDFYCYLRKTKRRIFSLLIPYVAWNTLFLALYALKGAHVTMGYYWDANGGVPICYPFWFIRDLMIMCLISPILYYVIKKSKVFFIPCLCAWYLMGGVFLKRYLFFLSEQH